jgi:hypothetical protein
VAYTLFHYGTAYLKKKGIKRLDAIKEERDIERNIESKKCFLSIQGTKKKN